MMKRSRTASLTAHAPLRIAFSPLPETSPLPVAWWPHSDDLQEEFASLIEGFPREHGRISHLEFSYGDWNTKDNHPGLHRVAASSLRGLTAISVLAEPAGSAGGTVVLTMADRTRLPLLVIPSDTVPSLAAEILSAVSRDTNHMSAAELTRRLSLTTGEGQQVWESEGGAFRGGFIRERPKLHLS